MISSVALKFLCVAWVGLVMMIGLITNGEKLYSWIGRKFHDETEWMLAKLDIMFITIPPNRLRLYYGLYLFSMFALGMFLLYPALGAGALFGIMFVVVTWKLPGKFIAIMFKRRVTKFVHQMVDALSLMSNSLRSGLNVPQALSLVIEELPNPISQEFALVLSQNKLGTTLEEALVELGRRMPHDDIEMFVTSINILKETGGNLAETFDSIAYTIRERIKVEGKIAAMVSQGVMQGVIVVLMPFALGAILYTIDKQRMIPMFTTIPGWAMLCVMIMLQIIGGFAIWKIVKVKV